MTSTISQFKKRSKVIAVNVLTGEVRKDIGSEGPRIFTVESSENNEVKLFQVGSYEVPLKFNPETGLPYLAEHSRSSMLYKNWKNQRIVSYATDSEQSNT